MPDLESLRAALEAVVDDWTSDAEAKGEVRLYSASPELIDEGLGIGVGVLHPGDGPESVGVQIRRRSTTGLTDEKRKARMDSAVRRAVGIVEQHGLLAHVLNVSAARFPLVRELMLGSGGVFQHLRQSTRPLQLGASLGRAHGKS